MPTFFARIFPFFQLFSRQFSLVLISLLLLSACKTTPPQNPYSYLLTQPLYYRGDINKNPNDHRQYATFTLENGMEIVLVSDQNIVSSAASLTIGVGYYDDPEEYQGLSHYLEHMVWASSEKFPESNGFQKLMSENNGFTNAYTHPKHTHYFFQINSHKLEIALDMFSAAINKPLLDKVYSEKELSAVNEEWLIAREKYYYIAARVNAQTSNPAHPSNKFDIGNLESLKDHKDISLNQQLKKYHQQQYNAHKMKLVIASNHSLVELKRFTKQYFSDFKTNKENKQQKVTDNLANPNLPAIHLEKHYGKHLFVKTKETGNWLELKFPLKNNYHNWRAKSNFYLYELYNSEEKGSLKHTLFEQGWLNKFNVTLHPNKYINSGEISFLMELSESGTQQKDEIVASIFDYTEMIKATGISQGYFDQIKDNMVKNWRVSAQPEALELVNMVSTDMQTLPVKDVLIYRYLATSFSAKEVAEILAEITPKKMRLWHYSNTQETDTELTYANGSYRVEDFSEQDFQAWQQTSLALILPPEKIAEIKKSIVYTSNDQSIKQPQQVHKTSSSEAWLANSQTFTGASGVFRIQIQAPDVQKNVKNYVMSLLLNRIYQRKNAPLKNRVDALYGIKINDDLNRYKMIDISLTNSSEYHPTILEELFTNFKTLQVTQAQLDREIDLYRSEVESISRYAPDRRLYFEFRKMMHMAGLIWSDEQRLNVLSQITLGDIEQFHQQVLSHNYLHAFAFGYYNSKTVNEMTLKARAILGESSLQTRWEYTPDFVAVQSKNETKLIESTEPSVAVLDSYIYPEKSEKVQFQLFVLNQLMSQALFNDLRTNQQMAYSVYSFHNQINEYPSLSMFLQSGNASPDKIKKAFEQFLPSFQQQLDALTPQVLNQIKMSIKQQFNKRPQYLVTEAETFEYDWFENNLLFNTREQQLQYLNELTKQDLVNLYDEMFLAGNSQRVTVQVKGQQSNK